MLRSYLALAVVEEAINLGEDDSWHDKGDLSASINHQLRDHN